MADNNNSKEDTPDVLQELQKIDTSSVDELKRITGQIETLDQRLAKLADEATAASPEVIERIREDYQGKRAALADEAAPLAQKARSEQEKLARLLAEVEQGAEESQLRKEELELRHKLGEFDDEEFKKLTADLDKSLEQHSERLSALGDVRELFSSALGADFTVQPPPKPTPAPEPSSDAATEPEVEPQPEREPEPEPEPEPESEPASEAKAETEPEPAPPPPPPAETSGAKTAMLTMGRLKALDTDKEVPDIMLGPLTTIGRTSDNDLEISEPLVSRKHASIELVDQGFLLKDLESGNGTYVNGEVIKEHLLADGDRIQIGTRRFKYIA